MATEWHRSIVQMLQVKIIFKLKFFNSGWFSIFFVS